MIFGLFILVIIVFRIYYALIKCTLDFARDRRERKRQQELATFADWNASAWRNNAWRNSARRDRRRFR